MHSHWFPRFEGCCFLCFCPRTIFAGNQQSFLKTKLGVRTTRSPLHFFFKYMMCEFIWLLFLRLCTCEGHLCWWPIFIGPARALCVRTDNLRLNLRCSSGGWIAAPVCVELRVSFRRYEKSWKALSFLTS